MNRRIVREVIRKPLKEAGLGWAWPSSPSPIIWGYTPWRSRDIMVVNFDGALIFHLGELGPFEMEGPPTGCWTESDLQPAQERARALLRWRLTPDRTPPEGWARMDPSGSAFLFG